MGEMKIFVNDISGWCPEYTHGLRIKREINKNWSNDMNRYFFKKIY